MDAITFLFMKRRDEISRDANQECSPRNQSRFCAIKYRWLLKLLPFSSSAKTSFKTTRAALNTRGGSYYLDIFVDFSSEFSLFSKLENFRKIGSNSFKLQLRPWTNNIQNTSKPLNLWYVSDATCDFKLLQIQKTQC